MHRAQALYAQPQHDAALIARYADLIDRVARRVAYRAGTPSLADDLWSVGALGLLDAAKRFDPGRAVKFESFAEHRIRGAMLDELRRMDHLPRRLRAQADQLAKTKHALAHSLGREATAEEVAQSMGIELDELASIELARQPAIPLTPEIDAPSPEQAVDESISRQQLLANMTTAISALPERLQTVLALYYVEELTYREIAKVLQVSEPRVCQLHREAIGQVKQVIGVAKGKAAESR